MRKILIFASLFCMYFIGLSSNKAYASHAAGGEIIYVHISDSTYQFFFKFYRDCTGISEPGTVDICFYNNCTNTSFSRTMQKWTGTLPPDNRPQGSPVSTGCSAYPTKCETDTSKVPGYREWWYSWIETLPLKCNSWKFGVSISARNNPQTNIVPNLFYVETIFHSGVSWNNSSPYYSIKPIPYVCDGQPYSFNNGAQDADGDSLFSEMINPLGTGLCGATNVLATLQTLSPPITFPGNPLQTNNQFTLNGITGQLNFTATLQGVATLTIRTKEYRKMPNSPRVEIGSIMRDVQVQVLPCSTVPPKLDTVKIGFNGRFNNGLVYGCVGESLDFCFDIKSTDVDAVLIAEDNLATQIPGATMTYLNAASDSLRGCFNWIPTINDVGKHSFIVTIKDSTCKPPGILLQYAQTIDLQIWGPIKAVNDTSICQGEPAFLGVNGGGDYVWTVLSGTQNSVNPTTGPNPIARPTATTVYSVVSTINSYCPDLNKDTVTISVEAGPAIAGQADVMTCPNTQTQLNLGIVRQPGATYTVNWTPAQGLSSATIENPTVNIKTDRTYYATVGSSVNRCKTLDTVKMDILDGFSIENPDTAVCEGKTVDIRGIGDGRYTYAWTSATDPLAPFSNASAIVTTISPSDTGVQIYKLTARYAGCADSVSDIQVIVEPNPTVKVDEDAPLCFGDTMKMTAITSPNTFHNYVYSWTPGVSLDYPDRSNPIFTATIEGDNKLTLVVKTAKAGCSATDDVTLKVFPAEFLFLPNDTAICPGDTISIVMRTEGEPVYNWAADFNISDIRSQEPRVWPVTDQVYTVYGKDTLGCLDTNEVMVKVYPRAVINLPDSVIIYPGEGYQMDPGGNGMYYSWFPPLGLSNADVSNPIARPAVNTRYTVEARTESGCSTRDEVDVLVKSDGFIELPNAFAPGSRGNTLRILKRGAAELKSYAIYNRWGTKVFETKDISEGWDGTFNGENQPTGVYIYSIEAIMSNGQTINKQGNVTLIR